MIPPFFTLFENQYFKQSATLFRMNKKIILDQIFFKLWYIGQICAILKFIEKEIEKNNASALHLEVWTGYFNLCEFSL